MIWIVKLAHLITKHSDLTAMPADAALFTVTVATMGPASEKPRVGTTQQPPPPPTVNFSSRIRNHVHLDQGVALGSQCSPGEVTGGEGRQGRHERRVSRETSEQAE